MERRERLLTDAAGGSPAALNRIRHTIYDSWSSTYTLNSHSSLVVRGQELLMRSLLNAYAFVKAYAFHHVILDHVRVWS